MIKIFEQFLSDEEMLRQLKENEKRESLKIGDIVDIDMSYSSPDSRVFAEVFKLYKPGGIARVRSIICHRKPYLCDHLFEMTIDAFDFSQLADMEVFKIKMKPVKNKSKEDPYGEEIWDDSYVEWEH